MYSLYGATKYCRDELTRDQNPITDHSIDGSFIWEFFLQERDFQDCKATKQLLTCSDGGPQHQEAGPSSSLHGALHPNYPSCT